MDPKSQLYLANVRIAERIAEAESERLRLVIRPMALRATRTAALRQMIRLVWAS
jgi:hypothetical protein